MSQFIHRCYDCGNGVPDDKHIHWDYNIALCRDCTIERLKDLSIDMLAEVLSLETVTVRVPDVYDTCAVDDYVQRRKEERW